jgi:hypothetical protein
MQERGATRKEQKLNNGRFVETESRHKATKNETNVNKAANLLEGVLALF